MTDCFCNSKQRYATCCEPYLHHQKTPQTPEALMRSRYTAYCLGDMDYIQKTMQGPALAGFDAANSKRWATRVHWIMLNVLNTSLDNHGKGYVEFVARFVEGSKLKSIHEKSEFIQDKGRWYYIDGVQFVTPTQTISRQGGCPCGSQRKFKNCHGKPTP